MAFRIPSAAAPTSVVSDNPSTFPRDAKSTAGAAVVFGFESESRGVLLAREFHRNPRLATAATKASAAVVHFKEYLTGAGIGLLPRSDRVKARPCDRRTAPNVDHG